MHGHRGSEFLERAGQGREAQGGVACPESEEQVHPEQAYYSRAHVPQRNWGGCAGACWERGLELLNSLKFTQGIKGLIDPDKGGPWSCHCVMLIQGKAT